MIWFHTHIDGPFYARQLRWPVLRQGGYGVHILFTVSGFLITTLLLHDFYIRRALRIWPLYYAILDLYLVNALYFERGSIPAQSFLRYLPSFATFTYTRFVSPNYPGGVFNLAWTLGSEEQFYFFWPFVRKVLRGIWPIVLAIAIIGLVNATTRGYATCALPPGSLPTRIVTSIMPPIRFGVLLAEVLNRKRGFEFLFRFLGNRWPAPLMLAGLCTALRPQRAWLMTAWIFTAGLVGACVVRKDNGSAVAVPSDGFHRRSERRHVPDEFVFHPRRTVCTQACRRRLSAVCICGSFGASNRLGVSEFPLLRIAISGA